MKVTCMQMKVTHTQKQMLEKRRLQTGADKRRTDNHLSFSLSSLQLWAMAASCCFLGTAFKSMYLRIMRKKIENGLLFLWCCMQV